VVGLWRVAVDFLADFFAVPLFAAPRFDAGAGCFLVVRFCVEPLAVPVVAAAPDDTRVECFWRCRTFVVVAASAAVVAVNAASIARSSIFIVFRTIRALRRGTILHADNFVMAFFPNADAAVRDAIYASVVEHGVAPLPDEIALTTGLDAAEVGAAVRRLADAHVIVLQSGTSVVSWAPPFSLVPTPFRSCANGASWFAPCAWDAFGIFAAVGKDGTIEARCAWSGVALTCGVRQARAYGDAVVHLLVPAAQFWDDIVFT
jgi:alkylmercury lyase-like protein